MFTLFAQNPPVVPKGLFRLGGLAQELGIVLGAILVVGILVFLFVRPRRSKNRSHHSRHRHSHRRSRSESGDREAVTQKSDIQEAPEVDEESVEAGDSEERRRGHRRRRARREHRERNPTLAETGGLPPPRPEGSPPAAL